MVKTLILPDGRTFRLGRKRPVAIGPRLSFANYILDMARPPQPPRPPHPGPHPGPAPAPTPPVPAPAPAPSPAPSTLPPIKTPVPATWDYTSKASAALTQMYLNDTLGDCVIAGMAHLEGVFTSVETGTPVIFTAAQITEMYSAIGGYVPGKPQTDQGCDEQTALNYWAKTGFCGHLITGSLAVDATNQTECELASWLFGNLFFGIDLPDAWINPTPSASGFVWDVAGAPNPNNGHCVVSSKGAKTGGVNIDTWGMNGTITWAAVAKYAATSADGDLYTVLTPEIISAATKLSPYGFNWAQLEYDFRVVGQG